MGRLWQIQASRATSGAIAALCLMVLTGCASVPGERGLVGRPIAAAVERLGPPHAVIDEHQRGRYFTWWPGTAVVIDKSARNPSNWLEADTRTHPWPAKLDESRYSKLPPLSIRPPFEPPPCALTLFAIWDEKRKSWIARQEFRPAAKDEGGCGPNIIRQ